ncbi:hypothetical protein GQ44DRAFT_773629 [Phaeosphaeriaceae sp. PMI808]|nr:hypothetical protein GQ44DRAFT_773629 [Phaeosphaeriaceae sp. PMI808]
MPDHPIDSTPTSGNLLTEFPEINKRKQQSQQPRQLLSCTKCRQRKVKCDRTKPCSACCARGQPKDCRFIAEEGDYAPIQQSYELRKLRTENLRLKERMRAYKIPIEDESSDFAASPESQLGERTGSSQKRRTGRQKRFQGSEWQDSIYFGSPGLANVITDFAAVNIKSVPASLVHLLPRGPDIYTPKNSPPHPFPTLFPATPEECIPQLLKCLPQPREDLFDCLSVFEKSVNVCSFPLVPFEITKSEVERFLNDERKNAEICPDMLALLFAALALGGQHSMWDRSGGQWDKDAMDMEAGRGNIYIAAAMQALRLASFMHKPSLLGIQALVMIGPYLTNSGRFLDAWTLFGTTIRLAHSIGLHRHPKYLDPAPPTQRECFIRQTLWWWMLHMDEQYSMTLGRPLGISGIGDCPPPHELTTNPHILRFGEFVNHFTVLARQILSSDRLTDAKIDEYTASLKALLETMPEMLQFDKSWLEETTEIPEWPLNAMAAVYYCKAHTYLILLNRQRLEKYTIHPCGPNLKNSALTFRLVNRTPLSRASPTSTGNASLCGRTLVLASSENVLEAFLYFYKRVPAALISWTMGQQAFNACMILLLDAIELKSVTSGMSKVEEAYVIFLDLQRGHRLAILAVKRISWGLKELDNIVKFPTGRPSPPESFGGDVEMQGTQSEAKRDLHTRSTDMVMNATGMLLLEDPGLQSFVPEAFAPIAWNLEGIQPPIPLQPPHEVALSQVEITQYEFLDLTRSDKDTDDTRSMEVVQDLRRSTTKRSAPTRFTSPTHADRQPPDVTDPTPHASLPGSTQPHHRFQTSYLSNTRPPHLRHAQLSGLQDSPISQTRHNSCPATHQHSPTPLPTPYSSSTAPDISLRTTSRHVPAPLRMNEASFQSFLEMIPSSAASPNVHPSWAAKAVGRPASFQMPDAAIDYPPRNRGESAAWLGHGASSSEQLTGSTYAFQFSEATTTPAEHMSMDEWRLWMGTHRAA